MLGHETWNGIATRHDRSSLPQQQHREILTIFIRMAACVSFMALSRSNYTKSYRYNILALRYFVFNIRASAAVADLGFVA